MDVVVLAASRDPSPLHGGVDCLLKALVELLGGQALLDTSVLVDDEQGPAAGHLGGVDALGCGPLQGLAQHVQVCAQRQVQVVEEL
ncbi:hypothetical protein [Streptomyces sp. NPDC001307]|uniref:hypothetical protein n=1 Tax=Streptomyces sp. NPDC001307 TaxID=3364560 RepID=UPI003692E947